MSGKPKACIIHRDREAQAVDQGQPLCLECWAVRHPEALPTNDRDLWLRALRAGKLGKAEIEELLRRAREMKG